MTQVSPSYSLTIGGKTFTLDGTFSTLRSIQERFKKDILDVLTGVVHMRLDEIAHLIAVGAKADADEIGQLILDEYGALSKDYATLKAHLTGWLHIAVSPKADREKKATEHQAVIASLASPGPTTNDSPSAASDGSQANSGEATSGN